MHKRKDKRQIQWGEGKNKMAWKFNSSFLISQLNIERKNTFELYYMYANVYLLNAQIYLFMIIFS